MVTTACASAVDPTSVNDMSAYERNVSVMIQLYDEKKPGSESHMFKLLKMTHDARRSKINDSACLGLPLKKSIHSLGTING